jgi:signal recognition particle receptor subunit beta
MVLIVNSKNIGLNKVDVKPKMTSEKVQSGKKSSFEKNLNKINGDGFKELTDKLKNMNVKDSMKNIRITF